MEISQRERELNWAISGAARSGDGATYRKYLLENPTKASDQGFMQRQLFSACSEPHLDIVKTLVDDFGVDLFAIQGVEESTAVTMAVFGKQYEIAKWLLERGVNPNIGRPIISAINISNDSIEDEALRFVTLLVEHGCDVNQSFSFMGNEKQRFTALDWAKSRPKIAKYLRENGAKCYSDLGSAATQPVKQTQKQPNEIDAGAVIAFCNSQFGPVADESLTEIVRSQPEIDIRYVPSSKQRPRITLFTTGMSRQPMQVSADDSDYQFAELFIELPSDWKFRNLQAPELAWPIAWLRWMSRHPHLSGTSLGGPITAVDAVDAVPIAPGKRFSSMLLLAEFEVSRSDGNTVHLYRMVPLYPEEVKFGRTIGVAALLQAFDRRDIPFVVDLDRPSAV